MAEITRKLSELISDAANRGIPAGRIRRDAILWCLGNVTHDDASLQGQLKHLLVERQATRVLRFDTRHMVQAIKIREVQPLQLRDSSCVCWTEEVQECGLFEFSSQDRQLVASLHHEAAATPHGTLGGTGITVQFNAATGEAVRAACLGLLLKLYKITAAMWDQDIRKRALFATAKLSHHKLLLVEGGPSLTEDLKTANMVLLL